MPETTTTVAALEELYGFITANRVLLKRLLRTLGRTERIDAERLAKDLENAMASATSSASGKAYQAGLQSYIYDIRIALNESEGTPTDNAGPEPVVTERLTAFQEKVGDLEDDRFAIILLIMSLAAAQGTGTMNRFKQNIDAMQQKLTQEEEATVTGTVEFLRQMSDAIDNLLKGGHSDAA